MYFKIIWLFIFICLICNLLCSCIWFFVIIFVTKSRILVYIIEESVGGMHNIVTSGILLFRQVSIMCLVISSTASHWKKKKKKKSKTATEECVLVKRFKWDFCKQQNNRTNSLLYFSYIGKKKYSLLKNCPEQKSNRKGWRRM
jgi:hypothetical protein